MNNEETSSLKKIMTLNVNGFRKNASYKENVTEKFCLGYMEKIKKLIDKLVINENDIIIFQEIPFILYDSFKTMFDEYKIIEPKHLIKQKKNPLQCTVAICKKNSSWEFRSTDVLEYNDDYDYANKFVELQCGDVTLLGVHMPVNQKMWDSLIKSLKNAPYTYVVGDFNANEKSGEMFDKPKKIRDCGYNNLISSNIITFYSNEKKTSIDNIYINSNMALENVAVKVVDTKFTDHALCILEYDFEYLS